MDKQDSHSTDSVSMSTENNYDGSSYHASERDCHFEKSNRSKYAVSDSFMHMSIRNGDDHNLNIPMQKSVFLRSYKNSKLKKKKASRIFSSKSMTLISSMLTVYFAYELLSVGVLLVHFGVPVVKADFSDNCPSDCNCKWANGKREADCTRGGFTTIPTNLDHEIQILRMTHNYVRKLDKNIFHSTGLVNLQRIFMNHCHVQVSSKLYYGHKSIKPCDLRITLDFYTFAL